MIRNPSLEYKEMRNLLHKKFRVSYVVKDIYSDNSSEPIKTFCQTSNINFVCREYNSNTSIEDQENIASLPAIHVYVNSIFSNTYHLKDDFIHCIENEIKMYETKQKKLKENKEKWINYMRSIFMLNQKPQNKLMKG